MCFTTCLGRQHGNMWVGSRWHLPPFPKMGSTAPKKKRPGRSNNHGSRVWASFCSLERIRVRRALRDQWRRPFSGPFGKRHFPPSWRLITKYLPNMHSSGPSALGGYEHAAWIVQRLQGWPGLEGLVEALRIRLYSQGRMT